jgi:RPA family protein
MKRREPAYPVLIKDLLSSTKDEITLDEGYQRTLFISITGAKLFRVAIAGILMDKVDIGSEGSPLHRIRVADPTGGISFTIGRYSPNLQSKIASLKTTYPVVVIGKLTSFISKSGEEIVTINPEEIMQISKEERVQWNLLSVRDAMSRLWKLSGRGPLPGRWMEVERPEDPRGGEEVDEEARNMIKDALGFLNKSIFTKALEEASREPHRLPQDIDGSDPLEQYEDMVLGMINDLDRGDGTRWDELVDYVDQNKLSRDVIEEVISNLLDKGMVYEPILGYLKAI